MTDTPATPNAPSAPPMAGQSQTPQGVPATSTGAVQWPVAVAPSSSQHGYIIKIDTKYPGNPLMADPSTGKPFGYGDPSNPVPIPMLAIVTHVNGATETFQYDGRTPPDFAKGDFGVATGEVGLNEQVKDDYNKLIKASQAPPVARNSPGQGTFERDPDGNWRQVIPPAAVPPQIKQLTDGSFMLIFADGSSKLVTDANDQVVTDPALLAKFAHEIGLTEQQILNAVQAREVAAADLNLRSQQQGFTQQNTSTQTARQLVQDANTQTANDLANVINLAVNLPAQQAANERAAALARSNEANQRIAAAVNGETLARGAGTDAVSDAQWMLSHSAPAGFTSQLGAMQASPGLQPNFAAPGMTLPMPDLAALRRAAQGEQRQFAPDFSTALAASQAQPVAAPDLNALWSFYGNPGIRNNISLYSNQVPLPYPTDMHPYLLQNPGPYTGQAAISGAPEAAPPSLWNRQGYYTGMVGAG